MKLILQSRSEQTLLLITCLEYERFNLMTQCIVPDNPTAQARCREIDGLLAKLALEEPCCSSLTTDYDY